jgi:DASS family divalent anion:Na+ symporter
MNNKAAWHTFIWFASLVMMSSFLAKMGIMDWINGNMKIAFSDMAPFYAIICISLFYFYMHYIFASATAHITIFFTSFTMMLIGLGVPPYIAALMMTFLSILSSGLTHFGIASTPIFFGAGYRLCYSDIVSSRLDLHWWSLVEDYRTLVINVILGLDLRTHGI